MDIALEMLFVARLCVGIYFLSSAIGKFANFSAFVQGVTKYEIVPKRLTRVVGIALPWVELALGTALVAGMLLAVAGFIAGFLLSVFIIAVSINLQRGRAILCNCYVFSGTSLISMGTIVRNTLLLGLAAFVAITSLTTPSQFVLWSAERAVFSSISTAVLSFMILAFMLVTISLVEWSVDVSSRIARLAV